MALPVAAWRRSLARLLDPVQDTPTSPEDERYRTGVAILRTELAARYLRGAGIEFGALDFPLRVPPGVTVTYADFAQVEKVKVLYFVDEAPAPHLISDLETMQGIAPESQDFIIANHVLEHVEDPLKALRSIARVLRPEGIAYLAIPDKRFTFDRDRAVTPLAHLLRDHEEGPESSRENHYSEWARCIDGLSGAEHANKVEAMLAVTANIHFHVWDGAAMLELFSHVERDRSFGLRVENAVLNPVEMVWILRKA